MISNNKKIAKNAFLLYIRMFILVIIGLYTSRVILNSLGVVDYGLYNVVGGIVIIFAFLNYAMVNSTQRYITFELGKGKEEKINKVFITSLNIHILISIIVLFLAETIGLWFFYNKLNIPSNRIDACLIVYQISVITTIINILIVPYNSLIIAHEKMSTFAFISLFDGIAKLFIAYIISTISIDRLAVYAVLIFLIVLIDGVIYWIYCKYNFKETHFYLYFNKKLTREMSIFALWSIIGNLGYVAATQGLNLLLNVFFNPAVNAARGIAVQIQAHILNFSINIENAIKPQITKSYSINDQNRFKNLLYASARFSFFALLIVAAPILFETKGIIHLWLKIIPEHSVNFIRLVLITSLVDSLTNPLLTAMQANGKIKKYQLSIGSIYLLIFPLSYIALQFFKIPEIVFIVNLIVSITLQFIKLKICCPIIGVKQMDYFEKVIVKSILVAVLLFIILTIQCLITDESSLRILTTIVISITCSILLIFTLGLDKKERQYIYNRFTNN